MIEDIISIVKSAGTIYADKLAKDWPKKAAALETTILEERRKDPDAEGMDKRDMRKYDEAKKALYVMNKKVSALMKQQAAKL